MISLILAEVGSTGNRAVDQRGQAEALNQCQRHRTSGTTRWRPSPVGESAAKSGQGMRFEAADKEATTMVELQSKADQRITFPLFASSAYAGCDLPGNHAFA